eukprot:2095576-Rhodomonas_salina.2
MQPRPLKIRACAWVTHLQFEAQHGGFGVLVEPDDRVGHAFQNADPNREKLGRDPAQPTEVAEYKSGSVWELMVLAPGRSDLRVQLLRGPYSTSLPGHQVGSALRAAGAPCATGVLNIA